MSSELTYAHTHVYSACWHVTCIAFDFHVPISHTVYALMIHELNILHFRLKYRPRHADVQFYVSYWDFIDKIHSKSTMFYNFKYQPPDTCVSIQAPSSFIAVNRSNYLCSAATL